MTATAIIYVRLLDEVVDVWRPVQAVDLGAGRYRIVEQPYEADIETWQFVPGNEVECEVVAMYEGPALTAVRTSRPIVGP
jgi:hypothetical protein